MENSFKDKIHEMERHRNRMSSLLKEAISMQPEGAFDKLNELASFLDKAGHILIDLRHLNNKRTE